MAMRVVDSWALMALFMDEPAAQQVEEILLRAEAGKDKLLLCIVNWGEIYYSVMRSVSREAAEQKAAELAAMPIELVPVTDDMELIRQAAAYKATRKMSYADCFAAATAKLRNCELVTGDAEFKEVEGDVKLLWLDN